MTWEEHRARFNSLCAERPGLTVREYAEAHGLNPNTARRELKKTKPADKKAAARRDQKADHTSDHIDDHQHDHSKKKQPKQRASRATKGTASTRAGTAEHGDHNQKDDRRSGKKIITPAPNGVDDSTLVHRPLSRGAGRRFAPGNEDCVIHGRYAEPREQDIEAVMQEMQEPDFFETLDMRLIAKTYAHLRLVERARNRSLDRLEMDQLDEDGKEKPEEAGVLHPDHKAVQLLLNAGVGISESAKAIAHMRTNMLKTRRDEELHGIKLASLDAIAYAYEQQKNNPDMTYSEMAALIEAMGGKVPPFIMNQARIEAARPGDIDDTCTVPPEQLEAEARQFREMRAGKNDFIQKRRAIVAQLVDEHHFGDFDQDGEAREGEFIGADFETDEELATEEFDEDDEA